MIEKPINDRKCLGRITQIARELYASADPAITSIAARFVDPRELAAWIRTLPQRDDEGTPGDGPKVACSPPQRLRLPASDPNCVERAALYLVVAEMLDPRPARALATVNTPFGRHTLPVQMEADGRARVVVLDPRITRNAASGAFFQLNRAPITVTPNSATDWVAEIAEEPAEASGELHRVRNARSAMRSVMAGERVSPRSIHDIAYTVDVAHRAARDYGRRGRALHDATARRLVGALGKHQQRRNATARLDIDGLARVASRIGTQAAAALLHGELDRIGVGGQVLSDLERELNREGLSLGALAMVPAAGSLGGLAANAIVAAAMQPSATTQAPRNASWLAVKTPGVIADEIATTDSEVRALGKDIAATFSAPFEAQQKLAEARFLAERGHKPGVGANSDPPADFAQVYAWMDPKPTEADQKYKSYQGQFVFQWGEFEHEWADFVGDHDHWYDRMWRGAYDKAIEYRERVVKWRDEFKQLGGKTTTPDPTLPPAEGVPWRAIITVAGLGAAALIVPEVLRTVRRPAS